MRNPGGTSSETQRAMGHKSPASTVAYLHIDERDIDALILAL